MAVLGGVQLTLLPARPEPFITLSMRWQFVAGAMVTKRQFASCKQASVAEMMIKAEFPKPQIAFFTFHLCDSGVNQASLLCSLTTSPIIIMLDNLISAASTMPGSVSKVPTKTR